jgi:hypothetical protein
MFFPEKRFSLTLLLSFFFYPKVMIEDNEETFVIDGQK